MPADYDATAIPTNDYIDMNLNDEVSAWDGTPSSVEPGTYEFEIVTAAKDHSQKGTPQLVTENKVVSEGPMFGRTMRAWYPLTEKMGSRRRLKNLIQATRVPLDDRFGFTAAALEGAHFIGVVINDSQPRRQPDGTEIMSDFHKITQEQPVEEPEAAEPPPPPAKATPPAKAAAPAQAAKPAAKAPPAARRQ